MPCRAELPHLAELHERFGEERVSVIAVCTSPRTRKVDALIDELGVGQIVFDDPSAGAAERFHVSSVPATFVIDEAGRLMFRHIGFSEGDEETLAQEIETLLARRSGA
jgi:peroxiredoxin